MNSRVHRILASCTVVLKDGISLTLLILMLSSKLSSSRWDILYVDVKIALPPDGTFLMLMSLLTSKLSFLQILDVDIDVALKVILPSDILDVPATKNVELYNPEMDESKPKSEVNQAIITDGQDN